MRKLKKVYLATPNIAFAYASSFEDIIPFLIENIIVNNTHASFFYSNGYEVDVVLEAKGKLVGIEIKKGKRDVKQLKRFAADFGKNVADMMVLNLEEESEEDGIRIIPIWKFLIQNK